MKSAVVYWSSTGNTEAMAQAVVEGAKHAGAEAELFTAAEFDGGKMDEFDAVADAFVIIVFRTVLEVHVVEALDGVQVAAAQQNDGILFRGFGFGVLGVWVAMFVDWFDRDIWYLGRFLSGSDRLSQTISSGLVILP